MDDALLAFLFKLYKMGKISSSDAHREFGKREGYPQCCINYFVSCHELGITDVYYFTTNLFGRTNDVGYVQCPQCLQNGQ